MTDPRLAVATPRGRYYTDPAGGPDLISVTNALSAIHKPALIPWAAGLVADHIITAPIDTARRARTEPTALRKALVRLPHDNSERAKRLGTRVHVRAQALVLGAPYADDPEVEPYAVQLARWFRLWKVDFERDIVSVESTVFNRARGYAGTGDLWIWLPTGPHGRRQLWLVDYKTSAKKPATTVYDEQPLQLAALRHAPLIILPDDSEEPAPRATRTAILNLRPRSHRFIELPSGREQFAGFLGALATTRYLHSAPAAGAYPTVVPSWTPAATDRKAA